MPIHKKLDQDFFKKWSSDMAYVLGYFAADGTMIVNNRGAHFIEFTSTDRMLIALVQRLIKSNHKIASKTYPKKPQWKTRHRLQIGSKNMYQSLCMYGFTPNKSLTLAFPKVPSRYLSDLVRGYFDGDGCVHFSTYHPKDRPGGRIAFMSLFTSGSLRFLKMLKYLLAKHGLVGGSLYEKKRGYELKFSHRDSVALYHFMYHTRPVSVYLPRKRKIFEKAIRALGYKVRP